MFENVAFIKVEPYWNVKSDESQRHSVREIIKVEPYWNVKFDITGHPVYVGFD